MSDLRAQSFVLFAVGILAVGAARPQVIHADPQLGVEQIAVRLSAMNERRKVALTSYENQRVMTVTYQGGLSQGEASETVSMRFNAPSSKQFTVISASGPQIIRDNVFQTVLTAEGAAEEEDARQASALNLKNYTMLLVGREKLPAGDCLILEVAPKVASEFTYTGKVWVQGTDFAVVRIQGKPAVNPSPWISEGEFTMDFQKIGDFYFPQKTVSTSTLPLGVHARLTIQYGSYRILSATRVRLGDPL